MDVTIRTRNRAAEARCRACRDLDDPDAPWPSDAAHTCRRPPTPSRAELQARARRHEQTRLERELEIRARRLAEKVRPACIRCGAESAESVMLLDSPTALDLNSTLAGLEDGDPDSFMERYKDPGEDAGRRAAGPTAEPRTGRS